MAKVNYVFFKDFIVYEESEYPPKMLDILEIMSQVDQVNKPPDRRIQYTKVEWDELFSDKTQLIALLDSRRREQFDNETFDRLKEFVKKY